MNPVNGDFDADFDGAELDGSYTVKGTLSTYQDRVKLKLALAMKGTYYYYDSYYDEEYRGRFSASFAADVTLDQLAGEMTGKMTMKISASGLGSESFSDVTTMDVPVGYGVGSTDLDISIDGDKKLAGTGTITLPSGEQVEFVSTASLNGKTLQYKISLKGDKYDAFSKGSALSITIVGDSITSVSGTVLGQKATYNAAVKNYDGTYSGTWADDDEPGTWEIYVDNGVITGAFSDDWENYAVDGRVQSNGSFTFYTDSGALGNGRINLKTGAVSGSYKIPAERISGTFSGNKN